MPCYNVWPPCLGRSHRPRLVPFLFPGLPSAPAPATFGAVFVAGSWGFAVWDMFVAGNYLCVRELLNVRAANGEHGEVGSGWCTGSCAPPTCLVCLIPRCLGHVWGRFCSRSCSLTPLQPRLAPFLWLGVGACCLGHVCGG